MSLRNDRQPIIRQKLLSGVASRRNIITRLLRSFASASRLFECFGRRLGPNLYPQYLIGQGDKVQRGETENFRINGSMSNESSHFTISKLALIAARCKATPPCVRHAGSSRCGSLAMQVLFRRLEVVHAKLKVARQVEVSPG